MAAAAVAASLLATTPAIAANPETMVSTALVLKPLTLTELEDLDFGAIVTSGTGDLVADPDQPDILPGIGGEVYLRPNQAEGVYSGTFTLTATDY